MNASEIMDLINAIEERYAVDRWTVDGIHVWPILRIRLSFDLFYAYHTAPRRVAKKWVRMSARAFNLIKSTFQFVYSSLSDVRNNAIPHKQVDVVFISDGLSYAFLEGVWYEKFCDPLIAEVKASGRTSLLISLRREYRTPRYSASLFIQPLMDIINFKDFFFSRAMTSSVELSRELSDCNAYLASRQVRARLPKLHDIVGEVRHLQGMSKAYQWLFNRLKPSAVFIVSYYNLDGMAINLACRKLNIQSVDIQHGFQGNLHAAYGRWRKVPESGYELLPSIFWCWSDGDVEAISKWSAAVTRWHRPLRGGNLWLDQWLTDEQPVVRRYDKRIQEILEQYPGQRHILVTLQTGLADLKTLSPILEAMQRSKEIWRWWVRLHPCMTRDRKTIKKLLQNYGIVDIDIDIATDFPLYALLRHMDVHITHSSSTVIEAQMFDVPSVVFSARGHEYFPDQIASAWALPAFTTTEIVQAIQTQLDRRDSHISGEKGQPQSVSDALSRILQRTHQEKI